METGRGRGSADGIDNNAGDGIDGEHEEKPHEKNCHEIQGMRMD